MQSELLWFSQQIKEQVPSHLKRENIQFKEVKEQRKNLVTLNTNIETITSQIVNHSLARMLVEKFCSNTNHKNLLKFTGLLWNNTVVGFFIIKQPILIHFFFFLVVVSELSLYCSFPSSSFSLPVTNDFSISPYAAAVLATFFPSCLM